MVFLAAQHIAQFQRLYLRHRIGIERVDLGLLNKLFLEEVPSVREFVNSHFHFMVAVDPRLQILDFLHLCLRLLGMLPKVGHMGAEFLLFNLYLFIIYVEIAFQRQLAFDGFLKLFLCNHRKNSC